MVQSRLSILCFLQGLAFANACVKWWSSSWQHEHCFDRRNWHWHNASCCPPSTPTSTTNRSAIAEKMSNYVDQWVQLNQQGLQSMNKAEQLAGESRWKDAQLHLRTAKQQFHQAERATQDGSDLAHRLPHNGRLAVMHLIAQAQQKLRGHQVCAQRMLQQVTAKQHPAACTSETYQSWQMFPDGFVLPGYPLSPLEIFLPGLLITGLAGAFLRSMCGTHSAMELRAQEGEHMNDAALLSWE